MISQTYVDLKKRIKTLEKEFEDKKKYQQIVNSIFEGIVIHEQEKAIEINSSFTTMFGYEYDEIISKDFIKLIVYNEYLPQIQQNIKLNSAKPYEIKAIKKDGTLFWVEIVSRNLIYENKTLIITYFRDISRRKKIEEELNKLSIAVEQSHNTIVITDINGNIEYVNHRFNQDTGYTSEEVIGQNQKILKSGTHSKEYYAQMWQTIASGKIWKGEFNNIKKKGEYYWVQVTITPIKDELGKIINYIAIEENITELRKNEERLNTLINTIPDIVCYKDGKGRWLLANNADLELFCLTGVDYIGKTDAQLAEFTDEIYREAFLDCQITDEKAWENKKLTHEIEKIPTISGEFKIYDTFKIPTFHSNGTRKGLVVIGRDITVLKKQNKELIISKRKAEESNQLKTVFINNMSHEIRTPMNGILGFSDLLDSPNLTDTNRKQYTNIIKSSANQLIRIIDDILEISMLETKQVKTIEKEVCLNGLLLELFSIFDIKAKEKKIPLYIKNGLLDKESRILTDETKLRKILSNLLENALKFTNIGFIEFGYQLINNELELYVKDTGIGIKPESQKIIFERFTQEEKELSKNVGGLGLGLSITKENTELLGGKITLKSEKRKGSTFFIIIPYKPVFSKTNTINFNTGKTTTIEKQSKYTILIVEDEEINYLYIDTLLKKSEFNLITLHAKHGKEAVEICKENPEIDLVFMDIKMPIMSGYEATKLIKEFRPDLPIVAQTAYTTDYDKERAFSAGCDNFISKPIYAKTLSAIMNRHLIMEK